ncbi:MAG: di-trans,poly-cis-decaprenylcistransferase [Actinobacteria bacterium]|jgi:short-chain Z-isoprenyl diphosphate synthase|nr:di-trans,poly-cis-decaprenylcistransferase [Actinomycetota bacterium]|tara:strand:- start:793 stop:1557 length:765 start_codon:yes stop_codon:yes gene_type:complete
MVSPRFIYSLYESRLQKGLSKKDLPKHIGLIHDGHRRYARRENLLSYEVSYKIGMVRFKECLSWCDELGIDYVTSWLLSKENLSRPEEELEPYFIVLNELFEELIIDDLVDNFKIQFIGSIDLLPDYLKETINKLQEVRAGGEKTITIALGYGGRQEILDAIKSLVIENKEKDLEELVEEINDEQIREHLYLPDAPDIDLIIRTSGESRLSGFLLWQSAYSEFVFQDVYWPEFRKIDFLRCLREYIQRERRFGK